jgi:hypothetical protein
MPRRGRQFLAGVNMASLKSDIARPHRHSGNRASIPGVLETALNTGCVFYAPDEPIF